MRINKVYRAHLASAAWKRFCREVRQRDEERCVTCNSGNEQRLEVHHRTYERLGHELLSDCSTLCRPCHRLITSRIRGLRYAQKVLPPLANVVAATVNEGRVLLASSRSALPPLQAVGLPEAGNLRFAQTTHGKDMPDVTDEDVTFQTENCAAVTDVHGQQYTLCCRVRCTATYDYDDYAESCTEATTCTTPTGAACLASVVGTFATPPCLY